MSSMHCRPDLENDWSLTYFRITVRSNFLEKLSTLVNRSLGPNGVDRSSQRPFALDGVSMMLVSYQKSVEYLLNQDSCPGASAEELELFKSHFRTSAFTCRLRQCPRATVGFETEKFRREHETTHAGGFRCTVPSCQYPPSRSAQSLKAHVDRYHSTAPAQKSIRRVERINSINGITSLARSASGKTDKRKRTELNEVTGSIGQSGAVNHRHTTLLEQAEAKAQAQVRQQVMAANMSPQNHDGGLGIAYTSQGGLNMGDMSLQQLQQQYMSRKQQLIQTYGSIPAVPQKHMQTMRQLEMAMRQRDQQTQAAQAAQAQTQGGQMHMNPAMNQMDMQQASGAQNMSQMQNQQYQQMLKAQRANQARRQQMLAMRQQQMNATGGQMPQNMGNMGQMGMEQMDSQNMEQMGGMNMQQMQMQNGIQGMSGVPMNQTNTLSPQQEQQMQMMVMRQVQLQAQSQAPMRVWQQQRPQGMERPPE
jgi:hypothetical protein